ncbi:hypothetical protein NL676_022770 [Syzygium grande]|nr:hypothetical protein NL676_022770 [Syzygium grande]
MDSRKIKTVGPRQKDFCFMLRHEAINPSWRNYSIPRVKVPVGLPDVEPRVPLGSGQPGQWPAAFVGGAPEPGPD